MADQTDDERKALAEIEADIQAEVAKGQPAPIIRSWTDAHGVLHTEVVVVGFADLTDVRNRIFEKNVARVANAEWNKAP